MSMKSNDLASPLLGLSYTSNKGNTVDTEGETTTLLLHHPYLTMILECPDSQYFISLGERTICYLSVSRIRQS